MIKICILSLTIFAVVAAIPASAQFAYNDYKPSTLGDVFAIGEKQCEEVTQNTVTIAIGQQTFGAAIATGKKAFRVEASWNGKTRQISNDISTLIRLYEEVLRPNLTKEVSFRDIFKTEILVTDSGREFWLPIQEHILNAFKEEVGPVKKVRLYVLYLGCTAKKPVPVAVVINEFQAARVKKP